MRDPVVEQSVQLITALESASRLGWEVTINAGRSAVAVHAKRTVLSPGAVETEFDGGLTVVREHLRDALAHVLAIITIASTPFDREDSMFNGQKDLRTAEAPCP
jgi:hypothetical protein